MLSATTTFFIDLFLLFTTAALGGELATRIGQPALVGQLLVGVFLGPTVLGSTIGLSSLGSELTAVQALGTVFILFMAGLNVDPERMAQMGLPVVLMGVAMFVVPFSSISVIAFVLLPRGSLLLSLFLGLTISITALPVMAIMLVEFRLLRTEFGDLLMGAALVNELVAVTMFAVLLQLQETQANGLEAIGIAGASVTVFLAGIFAIYWGFRAVRANPRWKATVGRIAAGARSKEVGFALAMSVVLGASLASQYLGLTFVVGAFYAGILVTRANSDPGAQQAVRGVIDTMSWGFFVPLFFAFAGVEMNLRLLANRTDLVILLILVIAAILTKVGVGFTLGRFFHWSSTDALALGHLVSSRGAVELAMAVILLGDGVFTSELYTVVAAIGLITTVIAPIAARRVWRRAAPGESTLRDQVFAGPTN